MLSIMTTQVHCLFSPLYAYVIIVKPYLSEKMENKKEIHPREEIFEECVLQEMLMDLHTLSQCPKLLSL